MTAEEVKKALFEQCPVKLKDDYGFTGDYKSVSAVIYRVNNGKLTVSTEVIDPKANSSVAYVDPKHLFFV